MEFITSSSTLFQSWVQTRLGTPGASGRTRRILPVPVHIPQKRVLALQLRLLVTHREAWRLLFIPVPYIFRDGLSLTENKYDGAITSSQLDSLVTNYNTSVWQTHRQTDRRNDYCNTALHSISSAAALLKLEEKQQHLRVDVTADMTEYNVEVCNKFQAVIVAAVEKERIRDFI